MSTSDQRRWDTKVKDVERLMNTEVSKTTIKTPYEALHGYLPRFQSGTLPALSRTRNKSNSPEKVQAETELNMKVPVFFEDLQQQDRRVKITDPMVTGKTVKHKRRSF
ncbi:hypothetical protein QTP88_021987 [Uroleucon formosanum]